MNSLYCMPSLDQGADHSQDAMVCGNVEIVYGQRLQPRHPVDRGAVLNSRLEHSAVDRLIEAGEQCRTPILTKDRERADQRVGSPIRNARHDKMLCRGNARDRLAVLDLPRDQRAGNGTHPDLVSAIADRDCVPRTGREQVIERCGVRTDVLTAHIARRAVSAAPAALDGNRVRDTCAAPGLNEGGERSADGDDIDRDTRDPGTDERGCAGAAAWLV